MNARAAQRLRRIRQASEPLLTITLDPIGRIAIAAMVVSTGSVFAADALTDQAERFSDQLDAAVVLTGVSSAVIRVGFVTTLVALLMLALLGMRLVLSPRSVLISTSDVVDALTHAEERASRLREEIEHNSARASDLREEAAEYEELAKVSAEQIAALASVLKQGETRDRRYQLVLWLLAAFLAIALAVIGIRL